MRWTHWANFPLMALMVWSGILIYWANDIYPGFFPEWFYQTFHIPQRLAEGMAIHFSVAWLFVINSVLYTGYVLLSSHRKELLPDRQAFRDLIPTILHDLKLGKKPLTAGKFNAAQRVTYTFVLIIGAVEILTGFSIYKPVQLSWLARVFGGYEGARIIHFIGMVCLCLFFLVHIVQVVRSGWNQFRAMVTGFEVKS